MAGTLPSFVSPENPDAVDFVIVRLVRGDTWLMPERPAARLLLWWLLIFGTASASRVEATELALSWQAPSGCPDATSARRAITELAPEAQAAFPIHVRIHTSNGAWLAEVTTVDGARTVQGASCVEVASAAEAIVALALAPPPSTAHFAEAPASLPETPTSPPETPETLKPPAMQPVQSPRPAESRQQDEAFSLAANEHRRPPAWGAALRLVSDVGVLPALSLGGAAALRMRAGRAFAELGVAALWPRDVQLTSAPARGGRIGFASAGLRGCLGPSATWAIFGCLGLDVGRLTGRGTGVEHATPVQALWLAPTGALGVELWRSGELRLDAELGLAVPLLRPQLGLDAVDPAYRPAAVTGRAAAGIGWR